jgi:hypothetical protein
MTENPDRSTVQRAGHCSESSPADGATELATNPVRTRFTREISGF